MRALRPSASLLLLLLMAVFTARGFAAEIAELRNGFTIPHRSREVRDGTVRLYMDEAKKSFVDLPVDAIQRYSRQPDPEPAAAQATQTQPGPKTSAAQAKPAPAPLTPTVPAKNTDQIVREASETHGVDSDFIRSVIQQESAGNSQAVSRAGARGLMQLMPGTATRLGVKDSFSPEQNVHGGARYLRELLERYHGDAIKALAAYNAGPGAVDRYRGVPPYRETQLYVQRIVRQYNRKKQNDAIARAAQDHKPKGGAKTASQPAARQESAAATTRAAAVPAAAAVRGPS